MRARSGLLALALALCCAGGPALLTRLGPTARSLLTRLRPGFASRQASARGARPPKLAPVALQWKSARTAKAKKRLKQRETERVGGRITAYCICGEIDMDALSEATIAQDGRRWTGSSYDDVWHLASPPEPRLDPTEPDKAEQAEIFVLPYGCVVFWNLREEEETSFLELLLPFASDIHEKSEYDTLSVAAPDVAKGLADMLAENWRPAKKISGEVVALETDQTAEKLAVSFGLAQSVKLAHLEEQLDACVSSIRHIPEAMSTSGRLNCSPDMISRLTGKLFLFRSEVNLYSDILDDQPSWFWDNEEFAQQYEAVALYLDVQARVSIYNQRLDIVGELVDNLNDRLNHLHASKLEWIVIWLISTEIIVGFVPHGNVVGAIPRLVRLLTRGIVPV